jgi:hypothetical protein
MLVTTAGEGRSRRLDPAAWHILPARSLAASAVLACFAPSVAAQVSGRVSFSIEWHGPTVGQPSSTGGTLTTEADILLPALGVPAFGPQPRPQIFLTGGQLALSGYQHCLGHQGGTPCGIEVDALSYGTDGEFRCNDSAAHLYFSVDEQAVGSNLSALTPSVRSEAALGVRDVSSDVFVSLDLPPGPLPPNAVLPENVGTIDGDGLAIGSGPHYRGVGLKEPNPPGTPPDQGDNLDALDLSPLPPPNGFVYFSLDAAFIDPVLGIPNSGSAAAHGVPAAAVLKKQVSGPTFSIYAAPSQLGLDLFGPGTDDLDALILSENGDGIFEPSQQPCDWVAPGPGLLGGPTDMLLFSVRRGSALIGMPDSIFGLPIEPGDVLTTPKVGGLSPFPGIYIAAEDLGIATLRSGQAGVTIGDELDAMASRRVPYFDCNNNGVEDSVDIAQGSSADANNNSIPDECERGWNRYCQCTSGLGPCSNDDATAGCANSTGGGASLDASGTTSWEADDLLLTATNMPTYKLGLFLISSSQAQAVLGDGLRCIGSPFHRFGSFNSGATGAFTKGPGIIASACASLPSAYCIHIGSTWNFQVWYRNLTGPCGGGSNLTNGMQVTFTP